MNRINLSLLKPGALKGSLKLPKSTLSIRPAARDTALSRALLARCSEELYQWQSKALPAENSFILHDGPPYANGDLHLGHALNKILKDIIGRYQILSGRRLCYIPGWDCHGLPIELKALQSLSSSTTHPTPATNPENSKKKHSKKEKAKEATAAEAAESGKSMPPVELRRLAASLARTTVEAQKEGFKSWGVMGDWEHAYRTLDLDYEVEQLRVFRDMLHKGLIYRRFKPVWWSPSSGTALAEAELEYDERYASTAAFVRFPMAETGLAAEFPGLAAAIWTTTPWTVPANRAIAVGAGMEYCVVKNSQHGYLLAATARAETFMSFLEGDTEVVKAGILGEELAGMKYTHPLLKDSPQQQQQQPIITADFVTADSGTGLVHCAPGHGADDYLVCLKHGIAPFSPVDANGRYSDDARAFGEHLHGLHVISEGTPAIIDLLSARGGLLAVQDKYRHKYPLDWRTKQPVIVRATAQWFADVDGIKAPAVDSLAAVRFVPETGRSRLTAFVQGRSEWCISRQRAWGVPIPALYDKESGEPLLTVDSVDHVISVIQQRGTDAWWGDAADDAAWVPEANRGDGRSYVRGAETMDVWFDSGTSWAALKARIGERAGGRPLADLVLEGSDQHRGWFQSSLLTSVACRGVQPYGVVLTHGFCMDARGKKMSKSLGNVVAPADIIEGRIPKAKALSGGVDALRLWVACADYTKDVVVGEGVLVHVHEALRKSRVTARFLCGNLEGWDGEEVEYEELTKIDKYALAQLYRVNKATQDAYSNYQFNKAVNAITNYTTLDLSAFYLDVIKDRIYSDPAHSLSRRSAQTVMHHILRNYVSMLAPIVPLLTEEVWAHTPAAVTRGAVSPSRLGWYRPDERWNDGELVAHFALLEEVHAVVRVGIERARTAHLFIVSGVSVSNTVPQDETTAKWSYAEGVTLLGEACHVVVRPAGGHKCTRCWVYAAEEEEGICARCEDTLRSYPREEYEALFA
ncbi:isoleucyl-tRNA synthetase [Morchella conica CCBAS932]|uniref:isoleucine--tRNA ligase n=1 Tax=Morchella conica CCBAS932 TaxID=1392247 RepID=A0A3N4KLG2_9PEZI|nr:isoleucyl-tRNA synthetase [Morchella conica CCBAS932]